MGRGGGSGGRGLGDEGDGVGLCGCEGRRGLDSYPRVRGPARQHQLSGAASNQKAKCWAHLLPGELEARSPQGKAVTSWAPARLHRSHCRPSLEN